jgi:large subunit ribosomal protein L21
MEPYAVIKTGGKQYRVEKGDVLDIEKLEGEAGDALELTSVLAVSDGSSLKCGTPELSGASVKLEVVEQFRGKKLVAFKKKRRKGYKRKVGHRQSLTKVKVVDFVG